MITNERQYKITKAKLAKFERSLASAVERGPQPGTHPAVHRAMLAGLEGQAADLRAELAHYEALKQGDIAEGELNELEDLGRAAIEARIAANLTQQELAERVGVAAQQIQKWEATCYEGAELRSLTRVLKALQASVLGSTVHYSARKRAPGTPGLVVGSKVKAAVRAAGVEAGGEVIDALNAFVQRVVERAAERARREGRELQADDLPNAEGTG